MSKENGPVYSKVERITSLDFWRGAFLLMIYVNHVPDNILSKVTLRNWGFADSAEPFVFISGFSAMLAFGRYFECGGFFPGIVRTLKRTWQLLCAHVLLVFALSVILAIAGDFMDSKPIMEQFNFSPFFVETDVAIVKILKLGYMPNLTDILPIYIVFVLFFPLAWLLMRVSTTGAIACSFALWLWVNVTGESFANYPDGEKWFFNPMAWQFLFVCGMAACRERKRIDAVVNSKAVIALCIFIVGFGVLAAAPWAKFEPLKDLRPIPAEILSLDNKSNLSWIRIVHFFSLAVIAAIAIPAKSRFWDSAFAAPISSCGRHSLAVYCTGTVLSLVAHIMLVMGKMGDLGAAIVVSSGVFILLVLSAVIQKASALLKETEKTFR